MKDADVVTVEVADVDAKTTVVADAEITDYSVAETVAVSG